MTVISSTVLGKRSFSYFIILTVKSKKFPLHIIHDDDNYDGLSNDDAKMWIAMIIVILMPISNNDMIMKMMLPIIITVIIITKIIKTRMLIRLPIVMIIDVAMMMKIIMTTIGERLL